MAIKLDEDSTEGRIWSTYKIGMADKGLKLSRRIGSALDLLEMEMLTSHIHMEASPPDDALTSNKYYRRRHVLKACLGESLAAWLKPLYTPLGGIQGPQATGRQCTENRSSCKSVICFKYKPR